MKKTSIRILTAILTVSALQAGVARAGDDFNYLDYTVNKKRQAYAKHKDTSAFCYWQEGSNESVQGYQVDKKMRIASTSKVISSFLALTKFSPFHRFQTKFYVVPVEDNKVDLMIQGSNDPYMTYANFHFIVSELNRMGVSSVRNIVFDKKMRTFLGYRANERFVYAELKEYNTRLRSASETKADLSSALSVTKASSAYKRTMKTAKVEGIEMTATPKMSFKKIEAVDALDQSVIEKAGVRVLTYQSKPLLEYLKDMNQYSINFTANQIFLLAGGTEAMDKLLTEKVGIKSEDYTFLTGSGLPTLENKTYNVMSCRTQLTIFRAFDHYLKTIKLKDNQQKYLTHKRMKMTDIMMVLGENDGTSGGGFGLDDATFVKTGYVTNGTNYAGAINTKDAGLVWFSSILTYRDNAFRRYIVGKLMSHFGGGEDFEDVRSDREYTDFSNFIPFDQSSRLEERLVMGGDK